MCTKSNCNVVTLCAKCAIVVVMAVLIVLVASTGKESQANDAGHASVQSTSINLQLVLSIDTNLDDIIKMLDQMIIASEPNPELKKTALDTFEKMRQSLVDAKFSEADIECWLQDMKATLNKELPDPAQLKAVRGIMFEVKAKILELKMVAGIGETVLAKVGINIPEQAEPGTIVTTTQTVRTNITTNNGQVEQNPESAVKQVVEYRINMPNISPPYTAMLIGFALLALVFFSPWKTLNNTWIGPEHHSNSFTFAQAWFTILSVALLADVATFFLILMVSGTVRP